jgi:predicted unusual protein kinase regulating ubiquinone biosynthesis (AarF/ABC1/UbiB family)
VHRGRWHDGREVAVKVQYPGVREALVADVRTLSAVSRATALVARGLSLPPLVTELRDRLTEELDYEHEARTQRRFAAAYAGDPTCACPPWCTRPGACWSWTGWRARRWRRWPGTATRARATAPPGSTSASW